MNTSLEPVVKVSLTPTPGQHLGLDHVLGTGELPGDTGSLLLVGRHTELLYRHTIILNRKELLRLECH